MGDGSFFHLGQPCTAKQVLASLKIVDPIDGREKLVLTNMNEVGRGEHIIIDPESDTGETYIWPAGDGSWGLIEHPSGTLVISSYYDGVFIVFDLASRSFGPVVDFPGESYIWTMAVGSDNRIYGGTYDGAKLGAVDPKDWSFKDLGTPTPENTYLRNTVATPGGQILCTLGMVTSCSYIFDPKTEEFRPFYVDGKTFAANATTVGEYLITQGLDGTRYCFRGDDLEPCELPLPESPGDSNWGVASFSTSEQWWLTSGHDYYCYDVATEALTHRGSFDLKGGVIEQIASDGSLWGRRGQDYVVIPPDSEEILLRPIPSTGRGRRMHFLIADPDGSLWCGPEFGQTISHIDIQTGEGTQTGAVVDSGGEVYGAVALDGKVFTASYAGADFAVYDPKLPWDQWGGNNPRLLGSIHEEYGQCRPTGEMLLASDGMLYSGWQANYGIFGGALTRLNPKSEEITCWRDPLGDEPIGALISDQERLYLGTFHGANGLPSRDGDAQLGIWSLSEERIVHAERVVGVNGVHTLAVSKSVVYVGAVRELRRFDVETLQWIAPIPVPDDMAEEGGWGHDLLMNEDGCLTGFYGAALIKIAPDSNSAQVIATAPGDIRRLVRAADGMLYANVAADLYRIDF